MFFHRGQAAMRTGEKETEQSKTAVSVVCIGQAVVDCITRGVEGDPLGMGKTRAQSITLNLGGDAVNESFVLSSMGRGAAAQSQAPLRSCRDIRRIRNACAPS